MATIKSFEDFLDRMQGLLDNANKQGQIMVPVEDLENAFPELVYDEDERIRRELISLFADGIKGINHRYTGKDCERWLAWLEKQKPADKVEPKFKVGDFIVNDYCMGKVIELTSDAYLLDTGQGIPFSYEHNAHLWTIQDAKDGDVLVHNGCTLIFMGIKDGIVQAIEENILEPVSFGEPDKDNDYHPATKEQREILFQKMKEAGYKWDADKKELKKIEPKTATWKPNDEQIEALDFAVDCVVPGEFCVKRKLLKELLEQLKKLREEEKEL